MVSAAAEEEGSMEEEWKEEEWSATVVEEEEVDSDWGTREGETVRPHRQPTMIEPGTSCVYLTEVRVKKNVRVSPVFKFDDASNP